MAQQVPPPAPPPRWARSFKHTKNLQPQSRLASLPFDVKDGILHALLRTDDHYVQGFETARGRSYGMGGDRENFEAGTRLMQTCQQFWEEGAEVLYEWNVLKVRVQFDQAQTVAGRPPIHDHDCEISFLNFSEDLGISFEEWERPTHFFRRLTRVWNRPEVVLLFNNIKNFTNVRIDLLCGGSVRHQSLFWTCRMLRNVLVDTHVDFKFRHNVLKRLNRYSPRQLNACRILRCASVVFPANVQQPRRLADYLQGRLRVQDPWPDVCKLQELVKELPKVKRTSFRDHQGERWNALIFYACSYDTNAFINIFDELVYKSCPSWVDHWRSTELRMADRTIREYKDEIQISVNRVFRIEPLIETQKELKKIAFWRSEEAKKVLKKISATWVIKPLHLRDGRHHQAVLSPFPPSSYGSPTEPFQRSSWPNEDSMKRDAAQMGSSSDSDSDCANGGAPIRGYRDERMRSDDPNETHARKRRRLEFFS